MYEFTLQELESSEEYKAAPFETRRKSSQEYIAKNGIDSAIDQYHKVSESEHFANLSPEEQAQFQQDYFSFYSIEPPQEDIPGQDDVGFATDVKDTALSGLAGSAAIPEALATVAGALGFEGGKEKLLDVAKTTREFWESGISEHGKMVQGQPFLSEEEGQWFGDNAIKKVFMTSAESLPLMVATMPVGGAISATLSKAKFLPNIVRAVEQGGVPASKASKWMHNLISYGGSEAGLAALSGSARAGVRIEEMSEEEISRSPVYQELLKDMSPDDARAELRGIVEYETLASQFMATALGSAIVPSSGGALPRLLSKKPGGGVFREAAGGATEEWAQETAQSTLEGVADNLVEQRNIDPTRELTDNLAENAALGGASGALMGGGMGAGKGILTPKQAAEVIDTINPDADVDDIVAQIDGVANPQPTPSQVADVVQDVSISTPLTEDDYANLAAFQEHLASQDLQGVLAIQGRAVTLPRLLQEARDELISTRLTELGRQAQPVAQPISTTPPVDQETQYTGGAESVPIESDPVEPPPVYTEDISDPPYAEYAKKETAPINQVDKTSLEKFAGEVDSMAVGTMDQTDRPEEMDDHGPKNPKTALDEPYEKTVGKGATGNAEAKNSEARRETPASEPDDIQADNDIPDGVEQEGHGGGSSEETVATEIQDETKGEADKQDGKYDKIHDKTLAVKASADALSDTLDATIESQRKKIDNPDSLAHGQEVETNPSEAQASAENYKVAHKNIDGIRVSIENPTGTTRSGTDPDGKQWSQEMKNDYVRILGTKSTDGDHIDGFFSPGYSGGAEHVHIIDQYTSDGKFDEPKVVFGVESESAALDLYNANYEDGWDRGKLITKMTMDQFKKWSKSTEPSERPASRASDKVSTKSASDASPGKAPVVSHKTTTSDVVAHNDGNVSDKAVFTEEEIEHLYLIKECLIN